MPDRMLGNFPTRFVEAVADEAELLHDLTPITGQVVLAQLLQNPELPRFALRQRHMAFEEGLGLVVWEVAPRGSICLFCHLSQNDSEDHVQSLTMDVQSLCKSDKKKHIDVRTPGTHVLHMFHV